MTVARGKQQSVVLLIATVVALLLMQSHADAACSNPAGNPGDVFFSSVQNVMVYCNGTSWVAMGVSQVVNFGTLTTGAFCTATSGTAISCNTTTIGLGSLSQISSLSVLGNGTNATGNVAAITGAANQVLAVNNAGTALAFGAVNLGSSAAVTGILPIANGGTGTSTQFTQGSIVFAGASGVYSQDNSNFFWDATNHRLGIGTVSPAYPLSIVGSGGLGQAYFENSSSSAYGGLVIKDSSGTTQSEFLYGNSSAPLGASGLFIATNAANFTITNSLSTINPDFTVIGTTGNVGIGTTNPFAATLQIGPAVNGWGGNQLVVSNSNGGIAFSNNAGSSYIYGNQRLDFYSDSSYSMSLAGGNVGIGTSAPIDKFEVVGGIHTDGTAAASQASEGIFDYISGATRIISLGTNTTTNGAFEIQTNESNGANTLVPFYINSSGNVGIGSTSPVNLLDLAGSGGIHIASGAPSNTSAALYNNGGTLYWNGSALGSGGGLTGSGTTNYVARWTPNGSTLGTGVLYDNGTDVGIGTTNPTSPLTVVSTTLPGILESNPSGNARIDISAAAGSVAQMIYDNGGTAEWATRSDVSNNFGIEYIPTTTVAFYILTNGNLGIGTTNPNGNLHIYGSGSLDGLQMEFQNPSATAGHYMTVGADSSNHFAIYNQSSVGVYLTDGAQSWTSGSDVRLKKNIKTLTVLDHLDDYRAVSFDWKFNDHHDVGVIAQELYKIFPEVVDKGSGSGAVTKIGDPGVWGVQYAKLGAFALEGVKELKALFDSDHGEIEKLKADNDNLRAASDNEAAQIKALAARLDALEAAHR